MAMVVANNLSAINASNKLNSNVLGGKKSTEKLASGFRINRAGDDAAGLAVSEKMRAQIRGLGQAIRNTNDGISLIQTAEGALEETHNILKRLKEIATQASNGTYNDIDRNVMQLEVNELLTEIDRIADATDFNGLNLLNGEMSTINITFQIGDSNETFKQLDITNVNTTYLNSGTLTDVALNTHLGVETLGLTQMDVSNITSAQESMNLVHNPQDVADSVGSSTMSAINMVSAYRAFLGAQQNRLEHAAASLTTTRENIQAAESQIRDTDMATEMITYTKYSILQQTAQAMLAQANQAPQAILQLLR